MKKVKLETEDFNDDLFWDWAYKNLKYDIWDKLRYDSFKYSELWIISDEFEEIRNGKDKFKS